MRFTFLYSFFFLCVVFAHIFMSKMRQEVSKKETFLLRWAKYFDVVQINGTNPILSFYFDWWMPFLLCSFYVSAFRFQDVIDIWKWNAQCSLTKRVRKEHECVIYGMGYFFKLILWLPFQKSRYMTILLNISWHETHKNSVEFVEMGEKKGRSPLRRATNDGKEKRTASERNEIQFFSTIQHNIFELLLWSSIWNFEA